MRCWEGGQEDDFTGEARMVGGGIVGVTRCASSDTSISPGGKLRFVSYQRSWQRFGCSESEIMMLLKTGNCSND